jgi:hypothetical protein
MNKEDGGQSDDIEAEVITAINLMLDDGNPNSWPAEMRYEEFRLLRLERESDPNVSDDEPV